MKFQIETKLLQRLAATALKVIQSRTVLPAYQNFFFGEDERGTFLIAANPEHQLRLPLSVTSHDKFEPFMVDAHRFVSIIGTLDAEVLVFNLDMKKHTLEVDYQSGKMQLPALDADVFPQQKVDEQDLLLTCVFAELRQAITAASAFATVDPLRPVFSAVLLDVKADGLTVVGTDGHSLYKRVFDFGAPFIASGNPQQLAVPLNAVSVLGAAFAQAEKITIASHGGKMVFSADDIELIATKIEGRYPNYNSIIPASQPYSITFALDTLKNILKRVQVIVAALPVRQFAICSIDGKVHFKGEDKDFSLSCDEQVPVVTQSGNIPDKFAVGINSVSFARILGNIKTDNAVVSFTDSSKCVTVREDAPNSSLLMLTMPVLLD